MIVHVIVLLVILEQIAELKFLAQLAKMRNHVKMEVLLLEQLLLMIVDVIVMLIIQVLTVKLLLLALKEGMDSLVKMEELQLEQ